MDPLVSFLESAEIWKDLGSTEKSLDEVLDKVHTFSYFFPIAPGQKIYVTESFTVRSVIRQPARAVVFLAGPALRGNSWNIPVEGYNLLDMAARRGFFAVTLDYIGVGRSYRPQDGSQATSFANVDPVRRLIDFLRRSRQVDRVDLVAEGGIVGGGAIAALLATESEQVRSVVLSSMAYRDLAPGVLLFFSPQFEAFLRNQPNGFWDPANHTRLLSNSTNDELRDYMLATQPGLYPTGQTLQFWDIGMPYFDPSLIEVPALVIHGEHDNSPAPGDLENMVDHWAGGAQLLVIPGGHHVPRIEMEEIATQYVDALFGFIDP